MTAIGSATLGSLAQSGSTVTGGPGSPDYSVLIGEAALSAAAGGSSFDVPELGIIWPNGVNVNT